jgi:ornithine cyclodeaminase/alanine dehydrogenase-like protein (mu-crystallin family)
LSDGPVPVLLEDVEAAVRSGHTRIIGDAAARELLPLESCVELQRAALVAIAQGRSGGERCPVRSDDGDSLVGAMVGISEDEGFGVVKALTASRHNRERGLPRSLSTIVLTALPTGFPLAVISGTFLTAARTAATAYLAIEALGDASERRIGLFGAGPIAATFVDILVARGGPWDVAVFTPTREHREAFARRFEPRGRVVVRAAASARDAARGRPTLVAFTDGSGPFIEADEIRANALVVSMASRAHAPEVPASFVAKAASYADDPESAGREAAEFAHGDGLRVRPIGACLQDAAPERTEGGRVFKSVGTAFQDVVGAASVWRAAVRSGVGDTVRLLE